MSARSGSLRWLICRLPKQPVDGLGILLSDCDRRPLLCTGFRGPDVGGRCWDRGMSAIAHPPRHLVSRTVARLHAELDQIVDASTWSMDPVETRSTLVALTRLKAQVSGARSQGRGACRRPSGRRGRGCDEHGVLVGAPDEDDASRRTPGGEARARPGGPPGDARGTRRRRGARGPGARHRDGSRRAARRPRPRPGGPGRGTPRRRSSAPRRHAPCKLLGQRLLEVVAPDAGRRPRGKAARTRGSAGSSGLSGSR